MTATAEKTVLRLPNHLSDIIEKWKPVPGTDGWYEVSSLGRVRSWRTTTKRRRREPVVLSPSVGKNGYRVWCHRLSGKESRLTVHRTVALAFLGNPGAGRWEVRHLDNDKLNNTVENLVWGTPAENAADRVSAGTTNSGERNPHAKLTWDRVREVRRTCDVMEVPDLAHKFNVTRQTIRRIIRNETWRERA